jgi:hypothetical protein
LSTLIRLCDIPARDIAPPQRTNTPPYFSSSSGERFYKIDTRTLEGNDADDDEMKRFDEMSDSEEFAVDRRKLLVEVAAFIGLGGRLEEVLGTCGNIHNNLFSS